MQMVQILFAQKVHLGYSSATTPCRYELRLNGMMTTTYGRIIKTREMDNNSWLPEDGSLCNHGGDHIGIHVRSRPSVLKVTFAIFLCVSSNSNRGSTVCHTLSQKNKA